MNEVPLPVVITLAARDDLFAIWLFDLKKSGANRADKYQDFLKVKLDQLGSDYYMGKPVEGFPRLRSFLMKKRAGGDDHVAIYLIEEEVVVVRVFHTKTDIESQLRKELS